MFASSPFVLLQKLNYLHSIEVSLNIVVIFPSHFAGRFLKKIK